MKSNSALCVEWRTVVLAVAFILCGLLEPTYCQTNSTVLVLQQMPAQCGIITPDVGIHFFDLDTVVVLTAIAKPGYQFVYWLGDVSDPTSNSTIAYLDAPKIIIAVFERAEYKFLEVQEWAFGRGLTDLVPSARGYGRPVPPGGDGKKKKKPPEEEEKESDKFPVPGQYPEDDDLPVPIPEPQMGALLLCGSLLVFVRRERRKKKENRTNVIGKVLSKYKLRT